MPMQDRPSLATRPVKRLTPEESQRLEEIIREAQLRRTLDPGTVIRDSEAQLEDRRFGEGMRDMGLPSRALQEQQRRAVEQRMRDRKAQFLDRPQLEDRRTEGGAGSSLSLEQQQMLLRMLSGGGLR